MVTCFALTVLWSGDCTTVQNSASEKLNHLPKLLSQAVVGLGPDPDGWLPSLPWGPHVSIPQPRCCLTALVLRCPLRPSTLLQEGPGSTAATILLTSDLLLVLAKGKPGKAGEGRGSTAGVSCAAVSLAVVPLHQGLSFLYKCQILATAHSPQVSGLCH